MNRIKGFEYEIQIKDFLLSNINNNAWLWSDTPITNLIEAGIIHCHNEHRLIRKEQKINPLIDTGIDIIQQDLITNNYKLIQCKNGYEQGLRMSDLAGFYGWMSHLNNMEGDVYYTSKISPNITNLPPNPRIKYIKHQFINNDKTINSDLVEDLTDNELSSNSSKSIQIYNSSSTTQNIKLYDYQLEAIKQLELHYKNNHRGILSLMCGMGKTLISYKFSSNYKKIIIISPIRQFVKQNLNRFKEYGCDKTYLTISCDGTRHKKTIKQFIKSNKEFVISSTFKSIDVLFDCIKNLDIPDVIFIIDEFHNLPKSCLIDETNSMYKLLQTNFKILFLSATPRLYELENDDDNKYIDTEEIFGPVVYTIGMSQAIEKKIICDYKIWLPSIHEDNSELDKELSIYQIDSIIKAKCNYILIGLLNTGCKKTIIYCQDTKQIELMIKGIEELNKFYFMNLEIQQITSKKSEKERDEILNKFTNNDNSKQLLFSVRIMDECIDIPKCDSVYLTYPSESKIRTIQRICRSTRKDASNFHKISNIFVWCNEYHEILQTLSGIKEYDAFFKDKINLVKTNFYGKTEAKKYESDIKLVENYLIDIKEYKQITWEEKLKELEDWIIENKRMPTHSKQNNKKEIQLILWLNKQERNYKNNCKTMKYEKNKKLFYEFKLKYADYFIDKKQIWLNKLDELQIFIDKNNRLPDDKIDEEKKIFIWLKNHRMNYKNNENIFNEFDDLKNIFGDFVKKYKKYIITYEDIWIEHFNELKNYIKKNNKLPGDYNKTDKYYFLTNWVYFQKKNFINNTCSMLNENIKKIWNSFLNDYDEYFVNETHEEIWNNKLDELINFIEKYNRKPLKSSNSKKEFKLVNWISSQKNKYKKKIKIMKNDQIRDKWDKFTEKYKQHFKIIVKNEI
jgi:superfamily II DNA or RNA helicase